MSTLNPYVRVDRLMGMLSTLRPTDLIRTTNLANTGNLAIVRETRMIGYVEVRGRDSKIELLDPGLWGAGGDPEDVDDEGVTEVGLRKAIRS